MKTQERLKIFKEIAETDVFEQFAANGSLTDFLSEIWPISEMKSDDKRFSTFSEDVTQHYVNNRDYSWDYLFVTKLKVEKDEKVFRTFLEP